MKPYIYLIAAIFTISCNDSSKLRKGLKSYSNESDAIAQMSHVPVEIVATKIDATVHLDIEFLVQMVEFEKDDILIENGNGTVEDFSGEGKSYKAVIYPDTHGDVTIIIPKGVAFHKVTRKPNDVSNRVTVHFTDVEIDKSLKLLTMPVGKKKSFDPVSLALIVDDSASMEDNQITLSNAIANALSSLKGRVVNVYLYSTTQMSPKFISNAGSTHRGITIFGNGTGQYETKLGLKTAGIYLSTFVKKTHSTANQSKAGALMRKSWFVKGNSSEPFVAGLKFDHDKIDERFYLAPSGFPETGSIQFKPNMSPDQFAATIQKIKDGVRLGTKGSDTGELPLCTLATIMRNDGPNKILKPGQKTAFIMLTDQDQSLDNKGNILECVSGFQSRLEKKEFTPVFPKQNLYRVRLKMEGICDSGSSAYCPITVDHMRSGECVVDGISICSAGTRACNPNEHSTFYASFRSKHNDKFESGKFRMPPNETCQIRAETVNPNYPASEGAVPVYVKTGTTCESTDFVVKQKNASGQDEIVRITGRTLEDFVLSKQDSKYSFISGCNYGPTDFSVKSKSLLPIPGVKEAGGLKQFIHNKASSILGRSNYMISAIANLGDKNPAGCSSVDNAFESKEVIDVADPGLSLSICEDSYDKAFDWFNNFASFGPETDYSLPPKVKKIISVKLESQEASFMPTMFTFKDGLLRFKDSGKLVMDEKITIKYRE